VDSVAAVAVKVISTDWVAGGTENAKKLIVTLYVLPMTRPVQFPRTSAFIIPGGHPGQSGSFGSSQIEAQGANPTGQGGSAVQPAIPSQ
jgi:hypothetical protein